MRQMLNTRCRLAWLTLGIGLGLGRVTRLGRVGLCGCYVQACVLIFVYVGVPVHADIGLLLRPQSCKIACGSVCCSPRCTFGTRRFATAILALAWRLNSCTTGAFLVFMRGELGI